ncbi:MAG: hypothetical protein ACI4LA_05415 [Emergencia sp.]
MRTGRFHLRLENLEFEKIEEGFLLHRIEEKEGMPECFDNQGNPMKMNAFYVSFEQNWLDRVDPEWVHVHYAEEAVLVLEGTAYVGRSKTYDPDAEEIYGPGSCYTFEFCEPHWEHFGPGPFTALVISDGDLSDVRSMIWGERHEGKDPSVII